MAKKEEEEKEKENPREVLYNYVSVAKFNAFKKRYDPCDNPDEADKTFTDAGLRKYFNAYQVTAGDPLVIYIDEMLDPAGFRLVVDNVLGEPVLCVRFRS